jgi:multisubunit Na+/H+ antiporter MnhB subunit
MALAMTTGWKLVFGCAGLLCAALFVIFCLGTSPRPEQRGSVTLKLAVLLAVVAAATLFIVLVSGGPGEWCQPGKAFSAPGCA